jgi:hypothetical protein
VYASKIARARFALATAGAVLVISLFPSPSRAAADDPAKKEKKMPSYPALMKMEPKQVSTMMDADNSGYVSREEFMKFYEALYDRLDRDKNQQLTPPEFTDRG